jgi:hypothetical protein
MPCYVAAYAIAVDNRGECKGIFFDRYRSLLPRRHFVPPAGFNMKKRHRKGLYYTGINLPTNNKYPGTGDQEAMYPTNPL